RTVLAPTTRRGTLRWPRDNRGARRHEAAPASTAAAVASLPSSICANHIRLAICLAGAVPPASTPLKQFAREAGKNLSARFGDSDGLADADAVFAVPAHRRHDMEGHSRLEFTRVMMFEIHDVPLAPAGGEADANAVPDALAEIRLISMPV